MDQYGDKRLLRIFVTIVTLILAASVACERASQTNTLSHIRISVPYDVDTLDPHAKNTLSNFAIVSNIYESLVTTDSTMRIVPCLAVLWENPDQNTWIFHLRSGVRFHSGKSLTSEDVVYSFKRLLTEKKLEISGYLQGIRDVKALDAGRVQIQTNRPSMVFLNKIRFVAIIPAGRTGDKLEMQPDGTGPYRLESWTNRTAVDLVRNNNYWGKRPDLDSVSFSLNRFPDQALQDLASGKFDFVQCNSKKLESAVQGNPRFQIYHADSLFMKYLSYDLFRDNTPGSSVQPNPFRNKLVRQALNYGIDRKRLVADLSTYSVPATQLVPPFIFGFNQRILLPEYDPEKARDLLRQAGLGSGFHVTLHARQIFQEAAELIQKQLKVIGIDVEAKVLPDKELFDALDRKQATLFLSRMGCTTGDASDILDNSLHSIDEQRHFGWHNYGGYSNEQVDKDIEQSNEVALVEQRKSTLQRIMQEVMDDLAWIPLYTDQDAYAVDRSLRWQPRNDSFILAAEINKRAR